MLAFLRARRLLLVLDNCEHLIEACAALVDRLLAACPDLRILATSRESLQVAGEHQVRVAPLAVPDPAAAIDEIARSPAVECFVARAQGVDASFRLTPDNAATIGAVCRRLDGIPLALALAAARARVLTVGEILARLEDCFRLLTGGSRATPARQQTLKATLDWSYALLTPAERAVLRRLAVFAGGATLDAAEAVCADDDVGADAVLDALTRLIDKSLLGVEQAGETVRYRLLEPVRQYGVRHLDAACEHGPARARHAACYLALAERASPALYGPEQAPWLARLEHEHDNLRAALRWARERGETITELRLGAALARFWCRHSHLREGREWLEGALARAVGEVPAGVRARALHGAGLLAQRARRPAGGGAVA